MLEKPNVTQTAAQLTAAIALTIPRGEIRRVMGPGISEVMATLVAQGIAPAGPWLTYHRRMDPKVFDFEIAVPVAKEVAESGRVRPGTLPAAKVARAVYVGGYEGLGAAWGELDAWIAANGHQPRGDLWECYVAGPESGPDSSKWRTELNRPLRA
jgi:effector-binding domain-containing protein